MWKMHWNVDNCWGFFHAPGGKESRKSGLRMWKTDMMVKKAEISCSLVGIASCCSLQTADFSQRTDTVCKLSWHQSVMPHCNSSFWWGVSMSLQCSETIAFNLLSNSQWKCCHVSSELSSNAWTSWEIHWVSTICPLFQNKPKTAWPLNLLAFACLCWWHMAGMGSQWRGCQDGPHFHCEWPWTTPHSNIQSFCECSLPFLHLQSQPALSIVPPLLSSSLLEAHANISILRFGQTNDTPGTDKRPPKHLSVCGIRWGMIVCVVCSDTSNAESTNWHVHTQLLSLGEWLTCNKKLDATHAGNLHHWKSVTEGLFHEWQTIFWVFLRAFTTVFKNHLGEDTSIWNFLQLSFLARAHVDFCRPNFLLVITCDSVTS